MPLYTGCWIVLPNSLLTVFVVREIAANRVLLPGIRYHVGRRLLITNNKVQNFTFIKSQITGQRNHNDLIDTSNTERTTSLAMPSFVRSNLTEPGRYSTAPETIKPYRWLR